MKRILELWFDWSKLIWYGCIIAFILSPVGWGWLPLIVGVAAGTSSFVDDAKKQYKYDEDLILIHYNRGYKDGWYEALNDKYESDELDS
jgi:hypothetical protein